MDVIELAIDDAYRSLLRRRADPVGLSDYAKAVRAGTLTMDSVRDALLTSPEYQVRLADAENRDRINNLVIGATQSVVQGGPFKGMTLLPLSARGDGDVSPKLLGTYEQELHPALTGLSQTRYDAIVDVGCAEGYFAVGLAKMFPGVPVLAYDTEQEALAILRRNAEANGCLDQIETRDFCDPGELQRLYERYARLLVIADCEGYEKTLFGDPQTNAQSSVADLIIECHDLWDDTITPSIVAALSPTHEIEIVWASGRNPNVYDFLAHLSDWDRFRAVWERRGARQNWLVCRAKASATR